MHSLNIYSIFVTKSVLKWVIFKDVKKLHPPNIPLILLTFEVSKFWTSSDSRALQLKKTSDMSSTFFVSKFFIFKYFILWQSLNILFMVCKFGVLKCSKSRDDNWAHPWNILCIWVTDSVVKEVISRFSNWLHPSNMEPISWTEDVSKFLRSKVFKERQLRKKASKFVIFEMLKLLISKNSNEWQL